MTAFKTVAVLGATGDLGTATVPRLLEAGFTVTVISRPESKPHNFQGVLTRIASYDDLSGLIKALQGQQAVVEAYNPAAGASQEIIVQACLAARVEHVLGPEYAGDTFNPHMAELPNYAPKTAATQVLRDAAASGAIAWTAVIVGVWFDWAIEKNLFLLDKETHTIKRVGSGNQRIAMSSLEDVAKATVVVLQNPSTYKNRPAYFATYHSTVNEVTKMVKDISDYEWKVEDTEVDNLMEKGLHMWREDTENGVTNRLSTAAYRLIGIAAMFNEDNRYGVDFRDKVEPGWEKSHEELKLHLKKLLD